MNRVVKNWRTTSMGVLGSAVALTLFKSFGCSLPQDWGAWLTSVGATLIPLVVGAVSKDS